MKKICFLISTLSVLFFFTSCQTCQENEGEIVVNNYSESSDLITAIYAKPADEDSYTLRWSNSSGISYTQNACFTVEEGDYDLRVYVTKKTEYFPYTAYIKYETGYKNPVSVKENKSSYVTYDGKGIYQ